MKKNNIIFVSRHLRNIIRMEVVLTVLVLQVLANLVQPTWIPEMENPELFQGDIVLDPDERNADGSLSYASMKGGRWANGVVPYLIDESLQSESQALETINAAIADYHKYTCIRFQRRSFQKEYVLFKKGSGCSSPVGYRKHRVNTISLGRSCWHKGTIMHEMGHSMGFWHEQSRPDRDNYVKIMWDNIQDGMDYNFDKYTTAEIDSLGTPYDLESMMHYGTTLFSKNGQRTIKVLDYSKRLLIGQREHFSNIDVKQLNLMYNCPVFKGTVPPKICEDSKKMHCSFYKRRGYCAQAKHEKSMYKYCCKTCYEHVAGTGGSHTYPTVSPTKPTGCVDKETKDTCRYWANLGNCDSKQKVLREFMKKNCCATCRDHGRQ